MLATGLHYHILEWGAELDSDYTLILLHGFLDNAWGWEAVVDGGLDGLHIVAPDMRGHGDSDWVGKGGYYHFVDYLADLHDLIAQLGRRRLVLVGHSMGGVIASYYAGTYPEQVERLVLLEGLGPPEATEEVPDRVAAWIAAWRRPRAGRSFATLEEAAARLRMHDELLTPELALRLVAHGTRRDSDGRLRFKHDPLHTTPSAYGFHLETAAQFWRRVACPTLLIEGNQSFFHHAIDELEQRRRCFAQATVEILEGAGHMMQRHQPVALARLIANFVRSQF